MDDPYPSGDKVSTCTSQTFGFVAGAGALCFYQLFAGPHIFPDVRAGQSSGHPIGRLKSRYGKV